MSLDPDCFPTDLSEARSSYPPAYFAQLYRVPTKIAAHPVFGSKYWHSRRENARWVHFCRKFDYQGNYVIEIRQHG